MDTKLENEGASAADDRSIQDPLERLTAECLDRIEAEGDGAIEELCRIHPEHAAALRAEIAKLSMLGFLRGPSSATRSFPERLGGFRLLERLGGGGMGVVFAAEQEGLGRRVALKLVRPEQMYFPGARERFQREVEAVARLQHPGIVPIYTFGEEAGIPYFAMELIDGCTLADVMRSLQGSKAQRLTGRDLALAIARCTSAAEPVELEPAAGGIFEGSWTEACLRLVRQAADALEHAHGRGILHRDVKPSNLAITRTGRVMLFDFGLASTAGTSRITRSGSQPGSLPYMSPEQLRGERDIDQRSDVYSLGVTLYELLTLRAAYFAESTEETRRRILEGRRPGVRALNPAVSRDAETVCVQAMEGERARRYATALDLSRDLSNVLERRPIDARRAGTWLSVLRWAQRHPTSSVASTVALLLALAAALYFGHEQKAHAAELKIERDVAQARFEEIRKLATSFLFEFDRSIGNLAGSTPARRLVVAKALVLLDELAPAAENDPALRADLAAAHSRLAEVLFELGDANAALVHYGIARASYADLVSHQPENVEHRVGLWEVLLKQGNLERLNGHSQESLATLTQSRSIAEELATADGQSPDSLRRLGKSLQQLAKGQQYQGDIEAGLAHAQRAVEIYTGLCSNDPLFVENRFELALSLMALGELSAASGRGRESAESSEQSLAECEILVERDPNNSRYMNLLSMCAGEVARRRTSIGDHRGAGQAAQRSVELAEKLYAAESNNLSFVERLANSCQAAGSAHEAAGRWEEALRLYTRSIEVASAHVDASRGATLRVSLAAALLALGNAQSRLDRAKEAFDSYSKAVNECERLVAEDPEDLDFARRLLGASGSRGLALVQQGRLGDAIEVFEAALERAEALAAQHPASRDAQASRGWLTKQLAFAFKLDGQTVPALERYQAASAIFEELVKTAPYDVEARDRLVGALRGVRDVALASAAHDVAFAAERRLLALERELADRPQATAAELDACARSLITCEPAELRDPPSALRYAERAATASQDKDPAILDTLALTCFEAGDAPRAVETIERALALVPIASDAPAGRISREELEARLSQYRAALDDDSHR